MSGITAAGVLAAAAVAGVAVSVRQGEQARKRANQALGIQKKEADRSFNAANPNRPNAAAMAADNMQAAGAGVASTTLTGGAGGAPVSRSSLGSSSLLGG
jgi:hypothetical protein